MNEDRLKKWKEQRQKRKQSLNHDELLAGILAGDLQSLSSGITLLESDKAVDKKIAQQLVTSCLKHSGNSIRLGITGVPGVGKSTFIESFGQTVVQRGYKIAVLAIDPSSERSGGSILGDKTRMNKLSVLENAFIRPSAAGKSLGGVARKTRESIVLCEAAGYDFILIETVGVGQSETMVHSMVDFFLLLMLAGAGDELQGIKRGIMEMADSISITKADGSNIDKAKVARSEYQTALSLFPPHPSGVTQKVTVCSALEKRGLSEIWKIIEEYVSTTKHAGFFEEKRNQQAKYWMYESIHEQLERNFYSSPKIQKHLAATEQKVIQQQKSSFVAAQELLDIYFQYKEKS